MTSISDQFEPLEVIGKGSFGTVRKVREKSTNVILVRKEIEYNSMNTQERNQLISELRILRELDHPNIVKYHLHDHILESKSIHIYMEYCDGGDLAQVITNFKKSKDLVPEEFIWQVLVQTLLALHRCHYGIDAKKVNLYHNKEKEPSINMETVIIHRDIKPDNIFILNSGKTIKLGDFGLAKMLTSQNDFAKTYVGTPYYMSPEVLLDNPYSPVCDIWSLGCVLFELCTLQPPFQAKTHLQLQTKIKRGIIPIDSISDVYSNQLKLIIQECITVDTVARPSCFELLESLSVRFLRKEMELKAAADNLHEYQRALGNKSEELNKKESYLGQLEGGDVRAEEKLRAEYERKTRRELEKSVLADYQRTIRKEIEISQRQDLEITLRKELERSVRAEIERKARIDLELKVRAELELKIHAELEHKIRTEYENSRADRERKLHDDVQRKLLEDFQKKFAIQKEELQEVMLEEFELRKRQMDSEASELKKVYKREFVVAVEKEVQHKLKEILSKHERSPERKPSNELGRKSSDPHELARQKSDSLSTHSRYELKPRGPKEMDKQWRAQEDQRWEEQQRRDEQRRDEQRRDEQRRDEQRRDEHRRDEQRRDEQRREEQRREEQRRSPLKTRNINAVNGNFIPVIPTAPTSIDDYQYKTRPGVQKKRMTDVMERMSLETRNTPEYEEEYNARNNRRS